MNAATTTAVYCVLIFFASLLGGWIPMVVRLTHTRMQVAISFVAGVVLGVGLLHLLPHSYFAIGNIDRVMLTVLGGFLAMFFLERFFHFHHHDAPEELELSGLGEAHHHDEAFIDSATLAAEAHGHGHHQDDHDHSSCGHDHEHVLPSMSWAGVLLGLTLHSAIDGLAVAAAVMAEYSVGHQHDHGFMLAGLGIFLAVLLHKPFDSLTIGTLMAASGWSRQWQTIVQVLYALVAPAGALLFFMGLHSANELVIGYCLAFAAGAFLCISTGDLLPELQFHSHDRLKLSVALLTGIALAWVIVLFESQGHHHHHEDESPVFDGQQYEVE